MGESTVSFMVLGREMQTIIGGAATEREAHDKTIAAIAQSFRVVSVTPLPAPKPQRRNSLKLFITWAKSKLSDLFDFTEPSTRIAEHELSEFLEDQFPSKDKINGHARRQ